MVKKGQQEGAVPDGQLGRKDENVMAKQGQHRNDVRDSAKSRGPNNPSKSVTVTTGTYKKKETAAKQAAEGKDPYKQAQAAKNEWKPDTRDKPSIEGSPRARKGDLTKSDEQKQYFPGGEREAAEPPKYQGVSETPSGRMLPGEQHPEEWRHDLNPDALAGQNLGPASAYDEKAARTAHDVKDVHQRFSGLADDDLKQIPVLASGTRLQQGATYFDLNDVDRGEFTAIGDMEAGPDTYYVPKGEVDYQLWNRLIGVDNPERIGAASRT